MTRPRPRINQGGGKLTPLPSYQLLASRPASRLSNRLLVGHICPDPCMTHIVNYCGRDQGNDVQSNDPGIPADEIDQIRNPGRRKCRVETHATREQAQDRAEVKDPVWKKPETCKGLMVLVANEDDVDEQKDHRDTPDHRYSCNQNVVRNIRQIGSLNPAPA